MEKINKENIIDTLEEIGNNGDIGIIKVDGLRENLKYSVIISSGDSSFDSIRFDSESLEEGVSKALSEYTSKKGRD